MVYCQGLAAQMPDFIFKRFSRRRPAKATNVDAHAQPDVQTPAAATRLSDTASRDFPPGSSRDIVLVGAGHTHLLLLRYLMDQPIANARITLVSEAATAWYSGMLPQVVSGERQAEDIQINAARIAKLSGARLVVARVVGLDPTNNRLLFSDRPPMPFDYVSLNLGAHSPLPSIKMANDAAKLPPLLIPVKPLEDFMTGWSQLKSYLDAHKKRFEIAVVGGGVASVELVLAIRAYQRMMRPKMVLRIHLVTRSQQIAPELPRLAREQLKLTLMMAHITVHTEFSATHLGAGGVFNAEGTRLPVDAVVWSTQVTAPAWCQAAGLACDERGFVSVKPGLQSMSYDHVFAVGDLANFTAKPLPKAGVHAVRQARVLHENLGRLMAASSLKAYRPQRDFLKILNLGNRKALACRSGLAFSGRWVMRWKSRLDEGFLGNLAQPKRSAFSDYPHAHGQALKAPFACESARVNAKIEPALGQQSALGQAVSRFDLFEVLPISAPEPANTKIPVAASISNTLKSVAPWELGKKQFAGMAVLSTTLTPLIWGDLFRLGRHAALWSLSRLIGHPVTPKSLSACLSLPNMTAPVADHDTQLVRQGIQKVLEDPLLNPLGIVLTGLTVCGCRTHQLEIRLQGVLADEYVTETGEYNAAQARVHLRSDEDYHVVCTHPMGAGFWGHAALSGNLSGTAWSAMTENHFQRVAQWWQVLAQLLAGKLVCGVQLIEADGLMMALQRMMPADRWMLELEASNLAVLPDLVDPAAGAKTLYTSYAAAEDNFWRLQRDFEIQPSVAQLSDWPMPIRALVDANVGLAWAMVVKAEHREAVLAALEEAGLSNAFCLGKISAQVAPAAEVNPTAYRSMNVRLIRSAS